MIKTGITIYGRIKLQAHDSVTKALLFEMETKNTVVQGSLLGIDLIIQWIIGGMATGQPAAAFANGITYGEIGTGTTTPALTDVGNTTPVARTVPSLQQDYGQNEAVLQFYWPDATLANDTFSEFATFAGGSGTLGSGNCFNHGLFPTTYTKSSGQDITVQVTFTLNNA